MKTIDTNIPKILLVNHNLEDLVLLKTILEPIELNFYIATNGVDALKSVDENNFDIILIDIEIPDIDGYKVCRKIKNSETNSYIPVLLLSSFGTYEDKMKTFKSGADDYLIRPL